MLAATTTKDLFPKSNYYSESADSVTTKVSGDSATVSIEKEGAALHYYGGTVRPKRGKALAIPLDPDVASICPSELPKIPCSSSSRKRVRLSSPIKTPPISSISSTLYPQSSPALPAAILDGSVPFDKALTKAAQELEMAGISSFSGNLEKALTEAMFTAAASSLSKSSAPAAPSAGNVKNVVDANGAGHGDDGRFDGSGSGGAATTFTPATTAEVTKFKTELPKAISPEEFDAILTTGFDDTDGAGNKVKYGTLLRDHINEQGRNAEDLGARKRELGNIVRIVRETQPLPTARAGGKERIYAGHIGDKAYVAVADEHNEIGAFVMVSYRRDGKHDKK